MRRVMPRAMPGNFHTGIAVTRDDGWMSQGTAVIAASRDDVLIPVKIRMTAFHVATGPGLIGIP